MAVLTNDTKLEYKQFCQLGEQISVNVTHWQVSVVSGAPVDADSILALDTAIASSLKACVNPAATYLGSTLQVLAPLKRDYIFSRLYRGVGTGTASDPMSKQTCGLITKLTGFAGRHFRGRYYVPFPGEADNDSPGVPNSAYLSLMAGLANSMVVPIIQSSGGDVANLIWSVRRSDPVAYNPVTSFVVRSGWATQRRRGTYGRPNVPPDGLA